MCLLFVLFVNNTATLRACESTGVVLVHNIKSSEPESNRAPLLLQTANNNRSPLYIRRLKYNNTEHYNTIYIVLLQYFHYNTAVIRHRRTSAHYYYYGTGGVCSVAKGQPKFDETVYERKNHFAKNTYII